MSEGIAADLVGHEKQSMTYGVYSGGSKLTQLANAVAVLDEAAGGLGLVPRDNVASFAKRKQEA